MVTSLGGIPGDSLDQRLAGCGAHRSANTRGEGEAGSRAAHRLGNAWVKPWLKGEEGYPPVFCL